LALITDYDYIEAFSVDYMHGNCLGVGKSELILWTDSKYSNQSWYIRDLLEVIDGDLLRTRPPTVINRTPRSIEEHLSYWKASELRAWILFLFSSDSPQSAFRAILFSLVLFCSWLAYFTARLYPSLPFRSSPFVVCFFL